MSREYNYVCLPCRRNEHVLCTTIPARRQAPLTGPVDFAPEAGSFFTTAAFPSPHNNPTLTPGNAQAPKQLPTGYEHVIGHTTHDDPVNEEGRPSVEIGEPDHGCRCYRQAHDTSKLPLTGGQQA